MLTRPSAQTGGTWLSSWIRPHLVSDDTNGLPDIFVRDLVNGTTTRVSVADDESQADGLSEYCAISGDGRYVAFTSAATNLIGVEAQHQRLLGTSHARLTAGTTTRVSVSDTEAQANNTSWLPSVSADGRYVAFQSTASNLVAGDINGCRDIFLRDVTGETTIQSG